MPLVLLALAAGPLARHGTIDPEHWRALAERDPRAAVAALKTEVRAAARTAKDPAQAAASIADRLSVPNASPSDAASAKASAARWSGGVVVWVSAGQRSRLSFDGARGRGVDPGPCVGPIVPLGRGGFVAVGDAIQDAGVRGLRRVYAIRPAAGELRLAASGAGILGIDGDVRLESGRAIVATYDSPRGFSVPSPEPVLRRRTTLSMSADGTIRVRNIAEQPVLRGFDAWLVRRKAPMAFFDDVRVTGSSSAPRVRVHEGDTVRTWRGREIRDHRGARYEFAEERTPRR